MFTGIIEELGQVKSALRKGSLLILSIQTDKAAQDTKVGDSIAVNGVCLTVNDDGVFDIMEETLRLTNLGDLRVGDKVNLEPALRVGDGLDGHFVSGHVDFVGEVLRDGNVLRVSFPFDYRKFFALKGSVALNGVSLTISQVNPDALEVSLVDFTLKNTNLSDLKKGDKVNVEVDLIARYLNEIAK